MNEELVKKYLLTKEQIRVLIKRDLEKQGLSLKDEWFEAGCPALMAGCKIQLTEAIPIIRKAVGEELCADCEQIMDARKQVAEEIKRELEKDFVKTFESGEGIVLSTSKIAWDTFWEKRR